MKTYTTREITIPKKLKSTLKINKNKYSNILEFQIFTFPGFEFTIEYVPVQDIFIYSCFSRYHEKDTKEHIVSKSYDEICNVVETCYNKYYNSLKNDSSIKEALTIKEDSIVINYPEKIKIDTKINEVPFFYFKIKDFQKEDSDLEITNIKYNNFFSKYNHLYKETHNFLITL